MHGLNIYDFGARQYDPLLGVWDRADLMATAITDTSPYSYCHNNPIGKVDPNGMADYFRTDGKFVRSDGNEKDPNIYILTKDGQIKLHNYQFAQLRPMMRIIFHYAKEISANKNNIKIGVRQASKNNIAEHVLAYTFNDKKIHIVVNNRTFDKDLSNIYNMKSTLMHEKYHTERPGNSLNEEVDVTMKQMSEPTFEKTTSDYKSSICGYLQENLKKIYSAQDKVFRQIITRASSLLERFGAEGTPHYINGGNNITF